jgi:hypothetical protein
VFIGPTQLNFIISKGYKIAVTQNIPSGGIQQPFMTRCISILENAIYSTHALHPIVRTRLIIGRRIKPKKEKRDSVKDGTRRRNDKLIRVSKIPWIMLNVNRMV